MALHYIIFGDYFTIIFPYTNVTVNIKNSVAYYYNEKDRVRRGYYVLYLSMSKKGGVLHEQRFRFEKRVCF